MNTRHRYREPLTDPLALAAPLKSFADPRFKTTALQLSYAREKRKLKLQMLICRNPPEKTQVHLQKSKCTAVSSLQGARHKLLKTNKRNIKTRNHYANVTAASSSQLFSHERCSNNEKNSQKMSSKILQLLIC